MSLSFFSFVTISILLIIWFEWPQLKQKPIKDRIVFIALLLIVWPFSILDLPNTPGPISFLQIILKPFVWLIES